MKNEIYKELTDEHIAKVVAIQGDVTLPNLGIDDKVNVLMLASGLPLRLITQPDELSNRLEDLTSGIIWLDPYFRPRK